MRSQRKRNAEVKPLMNLPRLIERFNSEDKCHAYIEELRWPSGVRCPRCDSDKISRIKKRRQFDCDGCRYQFSVKAGTIFHDSHLPLSKWFLAILMIVQSKKGISSNQLKRMLNISYKTAWYLTHRIRKSMETDDSMLRGIVEVDETYIGRHARGKGHGYRGNKAIVVGAVQRNGKVRLAVVNERSREELHEFIARHMDNKAAAILTDDWEGYEGIEDENTLHETVNHRQKEWVRGDVHTNTIDGVWSLLKRSIAGSYHKLSVKHLPAYLDEMEWRYSNRENPFMFRDTVRRLIGSEHLPYRELVGQTRRGQTGPC